VQGFRFAEPIWTLPGTRTHPTTGPEGGRLLILKVRGAAGLLGGDAPEAHALIGKKHCGAGQEKLAELEDRIEPPALKKQDAATQKADGGEENIVVTGQRRFKTPHEIEEGAAHGQHNADNAGPIQAGVDQGGTRTQIESTLGNIPAFPPCVC